MKVLKYCLILVSVAVTGCAAAPQVKTYTGPDGLTVNTVRCIRDPSDCFKKASEICGGSYRVINSYRNAGGLLADYFPGPVTWYTMDIVCGYSDGNLPNFPLRGTEPAMPASVTMPSTGSRGPTSCTTNRVGNTSYTNCY